MPPIGLPRNITCEIIAESLRKFGKQKPNATFIRCKQNKNNVNTLKNSSLLENQTNQQNFN